MIDAAAQMLFLMLAAHVLCDYSLQPAALSKAKRPGGDPDLPWPMALAGHSLIHGGAVALITGIWWIGVAETICHAFTDWGKGRGWFGTFEDQGCHIFHKIIWCIIAFNA